MDHSYTPFSRPASISRGTTTIAFGHDPEHRRFSPAEPVRHDAKPATG
jgi:hypothetical protein